MKNKNKIWILSLIMAAALSVSITGCGKKMQPETETETETESETEKVTEKVTEKITETEKQTETESETETEEPKEWTAEEEMEAETELKGNRTMYAADDVNVRIQPSTEADIISSYDQGEEVVVSAETKNWFKIQEDGYSGYVYKEGLSETKVEPKTAEERQKILEEQGYASDTSSVDLEYDVRTYAESFSLILSSDSNIRSIPGEEGTVVTTIAEGTSVTALGETERWYKIEYDGVVGFVNKNLVQ